MVRRVEIGHCAQAALALCLVGSFANVQVQAGAPGPDAGAGLRAEDRVQVDAPAATEDSVSRRGSVSIKGAIVGYTATAGTVVIRDDQNEPIASVFYTAYVADAGVGHDSRPVTFAFNGGPGASSIYLHMGSIGPMRLALPDGKPSGSGPFHLVPNNDSVLDRTDLVFIDAIGTGLSHAVGKSKDRDFWGVDQDVDAFARAIMRWIKLNQRWNAPKFLMGESYGGYRASGLASVLQERGIPVSGVVLVSSATELGMRNPSYDAFFVSFLPSLAAISWYHHRLKSPPADLPAFLNEVRGYALGPYASALTKGNSIAPAERDAVARQISEYTGLTTDYVIHSNLRVDFRRYRKELLRGQGKTLGALDARYLGSDADDAGDTPDFDATSAAVDGAFSVVFNEYLFKTLGYKSDRTYRVENGQEIQPGWDWSRKAGPDYYPWAIRPMTADLAGAMRRNPSLRVLALLGYYDLAAPFLEGEIELARLPAQTVKLEYYESGHMVYLDGPSLRKMKSDLDHFYEQAAVRRVTDTSTFKDEVR